MIGNKLANRLAALGAVGVLTAGLAHAGWLGLIGLAAEAGSLAWPALGIQFGISLVIAAAVAWQIRHHLHAVDRSVELLKQQVDGLEAGCTVIVEAPPWPEAQPLAQGLNELARRWHGSAPVSTVPPAPPGRRESKQLQAISPE